MVARSPRRRFITTHRIEAAREAGVLVIGPRDVVTDEARQRAMDLGVTVRREEAAQQPVAVSATAPAAPTPPMPPAPPRASQPPAPAAVEVPSVGDDDLPAEREDPAQPSERALLRTAVLAALRAELGEQVTGLEDVLDAVLAHEGF